MADVERALAQRARQAYERGRALLGLRRAAIALPLAAASLLACGRPLATAVIAVLLAAAIGLCEWRGENVGRGARIGLWAGLPALWLPILARCTGHACSPSFCALYPALCVGGGLVAGLLLVSWCARRGVAASGVIAAGLVAAATGALGCLMAGVIGLVALSAGLALGAGPALAWRRV